MVRSGKEGTKTFFMTRSVRVVSLTGTNNQMVEVRVCIENPPKHTKEQFFFQNFLFQHFSSVTSRKDPKPCLDHDICTIDVCVSFLKYVS